ncbi:MAG TPA: AI-2E family transporter, partial [Aggregicoccus sp.]|nr:AI-2E family transporter [Aggregicoccus sp.]
KAGQSVLLPITVALFLALLLHPLQLRVQRRLPKKLHWLGVLAALGVLLLVGALLAGGVWLTVGQLQKEGPALLQQLREQASRFPMLQGLGGGQGKPPEKLMQHGLTLAGGGASVLLELVLVVFFTLLMLIEAGRWREKSLRAFSRPTAGRLVSGADEVGTAVRRYLGVVTLVALLSAVAQGGFLLLMGVKLALVWALLVFLLSYVPIIGSIVSAVPPVLFAFVTQGLTRGALVALGMFAIEQVIGNFIAPLLEGKRMRISPLVVLAAVTLWGFIWGPVGALLAVPLTVMILAVCERVSSLHPVATLLGDAREQAQSSP